MAAYNDYLITNLLVGTNELAPHLEQLFSLGQKVGTFQSKGLMNPVDMNKVGTALKGNSDALRFFNAGMEESIQKTTMLKHRFDMNILSSLFAGMAMQRMGTTIMRFLVPSMDKLEKLNDIASKKIIGVAAAFEFMKISIFETLMTQSAVQGFIAWIIKAFITISEWTQKHPQWTAALGAIGIGFAGVGTALVGLGIAGQIAHVFGVGFDKLVTFIGVDGTGGKFGTALGGFRGLLTAGFSFYLLYEGIKAAEEGNPWDLTAILISFGLTMFAGVGWGIGFYFVYQGLKYAASKIKEDIQEGIYDKGFKIKPIIELPDNLGEAGIGKFLENLIEIGSYKGAFTPLEESTDSLNNTMPPLTEKVSFFDTAMNLLWKNILLTNPSLILLDKSVLDNTRDIPLMTKTLEGAKVAIDAIPNVTHKYIYIHTIKKRGEDSDSSDDETTGSVT